MNSQAKISQEQLPHLIHQNILWLNVPMHNAQLMNSLHSLSNLHEIALCKFFIYCVATLSLQEFVQVSIYAVGKQKEDVLVVEENVFEFDYAVHFLDFYQYSHLSPHTCKQVKLSNSLQTHHLKRKDLLRKSVLPHKVNYPNHTTRKYLAYFKVTLETVLLEVTEVIKFSAVDCTLLVDACVTLTLFRFKVRLSLLSKTFNFNLLLQLIKVILLKVFLSNQSHLLLIIRLKLLFHTILLLIKLIFLSKLTLIRTFSLTKQKRTFSSLLLLNQSLLLNIKHLWLGLIAQIKNIITIKLLLLRLRIFNFDFFRF